MTETKDGHMDKRKVILIILGILIILLIILSTTWAFYQIDNTDSSTKTTGTINFDCIKIEYVEEGSLSPDYAYPIKDDYAKEHIKPVKVRITNTCETNLEEINYSLVLTTLKKDDNNITSDKIRLNSKRALNLTPGNEPESYDEFLKPTYLDELNELSNEYSKEALESDILNREKDGVKVFEGYSIIDTRVIDENFIKNNSESVYEIQLWIDYYEGDKEVYNGSSHESSYDNSTQNKTFVSALSVVANPYEKHSTNFGRIMSYLRSKDTDNYLTKDIVGGMYRYQAAFPDSDSSTMSNWICFGTKNQEECTSDTGIDKYMYRIIGITEEGELYLLKETFLKEDEVTGFVWNDEYSVKTTLEVSCPNGICPEWNESDLFQRINGIANGTNSGSGGYNSKADTDIFVDNSYYDYLKSGDKVNGGGTEKLNGEAAASDWYNLIENHEWYYGDSTIINYDGNSLYDIETGVAETRHWVKNADGTITLQNYKWTNTINAKISLMYMHDVIYAYQEENPELNTNLKNSWIYYTKDNYNGNPTYEWLSTRRGIGSSTNTAVSAFLVNDSGKLGYTGLIISNGVRPVFYLSNKINLSGTGTKESPFIIS